MLGSFGTSRLNSTTCTVEPSVRLQVTWQRQRNLLKRVNKRGWEKVLKRFNNKHFETLTKRSKIGGTTPVNLVDRPGEFEGNTKGSE
jgi:hypothetical protein